MPSFSVNKSSIPIWNGANGNLVLNVNAPSLSAPLAPGPNPIVDASFQVEGGTPIALGNVGALKVGVKAGSTARLVPLFQENFSAGADLVTQFNLSSSLTPSNVLLALDLGGKVDLSAEGSFHYSVLSATTTLQAGADASYVAVRSFPRSAHLDTMLLDLAGGLSLPDDVTTPPGAGDLIAFEYGGYLNFALGISAGYDLKGTQSFRISQIALSEHYALSVIGKLGVSGGIAGRFSVEVTAGSTPGWARVVVRRRNSKQLQVAADINVTAGLQTEGLPSSGKEFLGALLGVRAKNWLNMVDGYVTEAGQVDSLPALKAKLNGLATDFINTWVGKGIDELSATEFGVVQAKLAKVVASYRNLDQSAIALFDRYFSPVVSTVNELTKRLDELKAMTSWDRLKGEVDPLLWNAVRQLTDGDPLGWALGHIPGTQKLSLDELHRRVDQTLALIQNDAHDEIRKFIALAKQQFGLDPFMNQLATISSPPALKSLVGTRLGNFAERLIGTTLDKLNGNDLKKAFAVVQQVVAGRDKFFSTFDKILQEAASQNFTANLHAAYNASSEGTALIDVELKLRESDGSPNATGAHLMQAAGRGNFEEILASYQPEIVRINQGVLTHKVSRSGLFQFNVAGWHRNFSYESMHSVVVNTEQQIRPAANGLVTVFTIDMTAASERRRNKGTKSEQAVLTNFLLRVMAETRNKISDSSFDKQTQLYAIDVIKGMTANYRVNFTDQSTTEAELEDALSFARQLGLDSVGATMEGLTPLLEKKGDNYGPIDAAFQVQYTETGLAALFASPVAPAGIRKILRKIVLANYFGQSGISDAGWLYGSDDVRALFDKNQNNFINAQSILGNATVTLTSPIEGIAPPSRFDNTFLIRNVVAILFRIEDRILQAFADLGKLLRSRSQIKTADLEKKMQSFGLALDAFDGFDNGDNSVFAVFDGLIQIATPALEARSSGMTFQSVKEGSPRTKVFTLQAQTAGEKVLAAGAGQ